MGASTRIVASFLSHVSTTGTSPREQGTKGFELSFRDIVFNPQKLTAQGS